MLAAGDVLSVVVEDIQWAGPLLLDFLEHLAEWVRDTSVIVIALADRDIRDNRAGFARAGGWVTDVIELAGLDPEATTELASQILADDRLPADLLAWLPRLTDGSPLFVREVVGMLVDDGVLVPHPDGWRLTIDVDAISVPPTVHALLASRLERTNSGDRRALEIASVIGTEFSPGAVAAVSGLGVEAVSSALDRLHRLDFVLSGGVDLGGQPLWCFRHALIRDVAYRRLLKSDRAELHERIADWVDGGGQSDAADPDEVAARHVEAAYRYRCDLGMGDARTASLGLRAARSYLAAARRALDSDALVSAGIRAVSGAALATEEPALQAELLQIGCEALLSVGDIPRRRRFSTSSMPSPMTHPGRRVTGARSSFTPSPLGFPSSKIGSAPSSRSSCPAATRPDRRRRIWCGPPRGRCWGGSVTANSICRRLLSRLAVWGIAV